MIHSGTLKHKSKTPEEGQQEEDETSYNIVFVHIFGARARNVSPQEKSIKSERLGSSLLSPD